jgi:hypothetical protein
MDFIGIGASGICHRMFQAYGVVVSDVNPYLAKRSSI